jgi:hypothetical protein
LAASAINPIPEVAITHMISENTATARVIGENTWIWILDHELTADSQSIVVSFLCISCYCVGANDRTQHEEGNDDFHDAVSMS